MKTKLILALSILSLTMACKKDVPTLGDAPTEADAVFTTVTSSISPNIIELTAANTTMQCLWEFGNGIKATGSTATATYPYAGTYTIKLTVFNKGGSKSSTKQVVIANDDLGLLNNPYYNKLTGGTSGSGSKTWVVDSAFTAHLGVGPDPESDLGATPEYWSAGASEKVGCGLYDDKYVFHLQAFKFDMITNGDVYIHNTLNAQFPGSFQNLYDYTAPYTNQMNESWNLVEGEQTTISISNDAFIGFYTGVNTYRILDITDSTLYLQYKHHDGELNWYLKLKTE